MQTQHYTASIAAGISPQQAMVCISDVSAWWATDLTGQARQQGDVFTVRFGKTSVTFTLTEVEGTEKMVWLVTDSHLPWLVDTKEWKGTSVVWQVAPENNGVQVTMTHVGLVPALPCFDNCRKGWDFYIYQSLLNLMTEGRGQPDRKK